MAQAEEQFYKIIRPPFCHRHVPDGIFENQIPPNDPGDNLSEGGVGISIGRTRNRDHGSEFAVTQRREAAGDSSDNERESDRRPRRRSAEDEVGMANKCFDEIKNWRFHDRFPHARGLAGGSGAGECENAGANDRADAETGKIKCGERAFQFALGRRGLPHQQLRTFGSKKCTHQLRRWLFRKRKMASCHLAFDSVNVNFLRASGFGLRLATERAYARCA